MENFQPVWQKITEDYLLLYLAMGALFLLVFRIISLSKLSTLVHWPTILTLAALLIVTTGIKESGVLEHWTRYFLQSMKTERMLWQALIFFSLVSAAVLTNDIALFLVIPFTLQLNSKLSFRINQLLIFETIAVNVGSMLTPIGNPQNIYLWQKYGIPFGGYVKAMFPVFALQLVLLWGGVFILASNKSLNHIPTPKSSTMDVSLASVSATLLLGFLIANHFGFALYFTTAIVLLFLFLYRKVLFRADWTLIILFLLLFVDVGGLARLPFFQALNHSMDRTNPAHIFALGAGYSQIISNVPATLLLSHYSSQWKYLAWGVNVGGNGLIIASFANLITLRLARRQKIGWSYHAYALPFLFISAMMVYGWIVLT